MTERDATEFRAYLRNATDPQLFNILRKEGEAGRDDYVRLCLQEIKRRRAPRLAA